MRDPLLQPAERRRVVTMQWLDDTARAALTGLLAGGLVPPPGDLRASRLASSAYEIARAMLVERSRVLPEVHEAAKDETSPESSL